MTNYKLVINIFVRAPKAFFCYLVGFHTLVL